MQSKENDRRRNREIQVQDEKRGNQGFYMRLKNVYQLE